MDETFFHILATKIVEKIESCVPRPCTFPIAKRFHFFGEHAGKQLAIFRLYKVSGEEPMFLMKWLVMTVAVLAASYVVPGIEVTGFGVALIAALLLGLVNIFIRPLLVILTLPATIMTLGFFLLIINALLLTFVAWLVSGFAVAGFWSALIGSIFISIVSTLTSSLLKR